MPLGFRSLNPVEIAVNLLAGSRATMCGRFSGVVDQIVSRLFQGKSNVLILV